jgi:OOP family OmpA-OmpF porin
LDEQIAILEKEPTIKVEIAGHTDTSGPETYNRGLSERRAKAVKAYFISKGIAPDRLIPIGYGESRPIAANYTREGRSNNRRVELNVLE